MQPTALPFLHFTDADGSPLNGKVFFGSPNQNPETVPISVYWDKAGTQPAAQPITVSNGYAMRSGSPSTLYVNQAYSITIRNSKGAMVFYGQDSASFDPFSQLSAYMPLAGGTFTGDVRFDGKVGVGAAGSTWTTYKGVDVLDRTALVDAGTSRTSYIAQNAYYDGTNWRSKGAGAGYLYAAGSLATPGGQPGHGWFSSTTSPVGGGDIFTFAQKLGLSDNKLDLIGVALNHAAPLTVASATTTPIGADNSAYASNNITISGTTTITSLGTIAAGIQRDVTFSGALILTHNATSLILPTGANITTAAGDTARFQSLGSGNWKCLSYQRASGQPLIPSVGIGQTWKIVTITSGATNSNASSRTIVVRGQATSSGSGAQITANCQNVDIGTAGGANVGSIVCSFEVPPGADYKITAALGTLDGAWELS